MKIILHILSGFLGSGKTTLLRQILSSNASEDIAILVNEFGEIGIDHIALKEVTQDIVVLPNGCICCSINEDLNTSLLELYNKRSRGEITNFKAVIIELSGLANPGPIVSTLLHSHVLVNHFVLGSLITVVDGIYGISQQREQPEWECQVVAADYLLISKTSLMRSENIEKLTSQLKALNPLAKIDSTQNFNFEVFEIQKHNAEFKPLESKDHMSNIQTCTIKIKQNLKWEIFSVWLSLLLSKYGKNILRFKALLNIDSISSNKTLLLNGVQSILHLPEHLDVEQKDSYMVFITKDLNPDSIKQSFEYFCKAV